LDIHTIKPEIRLIDKKVLISNVLIYSSLANLFSKLKIFLNKITNTHHTASGSPLSSGDLSP